jgi:uncharacterized SAM-binding protein YcdF (DUF218 family)
MRTRSDRRRMHVLLIAALAVGGLVVAQLAFLAALVAAEPLLVVRTAHAVADVIVVPGGDGPRRAQRAAEFYRSGVAPRILVTGEGDCNEVRDLLIAGHVSRTAITVECVSRNTWENARFSARILAEMRARRAVLVTSWFHTRRALACFKMAVPGVQWTSAPVERDMSAWVLARHEEGLRVAQEYLKIGWYIVHYGLDLTSTAALNGSFVHRTGLLAPATWQDSVSQ